MDFVECTKKLLAHLRAQAGFVANGRNLTKPQHPLILVEISDNAVNRLLQVIFAYLRHMLLKRCCTRRGLLA